MRPSRFVTEGADYRLRILQDAAEISCPAENGVCIHTSDTVHIARLLKERNASAGECRRSPRPRALALLKAGIPAIQRHDHDPSNTAISGLLRFEQLSVDVSQQPIQEVIVDAADLIVLIER